MDIASVVEYERLYPLHILHPVTEEPIGIVLQIRSAESDEAKKVLRKHVDDIYERRQRGKLISGSSEIRRELEKVASYIASWDWGKDPKTGEPNTVDGEAPALTMDAAVRILEKYGWLFGQVKGAAETLANFSPASAKNSAKPSG